MNEGVDDIKPVLRLGPPRPRFFLVTALLSALRVEETRRKALEQQLAMQPQATAIVSVNRDRVARELRTRTDDMRGVLRRQGGQAREALRTLLADRFDGTFGGLLAASTWPTTFGGLKGIRMVVGHELTFEVRGIAVRP